MSGEEDGLALVSAVLEEAEDEAVGKDVEPGGGFIKDEHRRVVDEHSGDGCALLLAGGKFSTRRLAEIFNTEQLDDPFDAFGEFVFIHAMQSSEIPQGLFGCEPVVEPA